LGFLYWLQKLCSCGKVFDVSEKHTTSSLVAETMRTNGIIKVGKGRTVWSTEKTISRNEVPANKKKRGAYRGPNKRGEFVTN
jgi:hypothetical protein